MADEEEIALHGGIPEDSAAEAAGDAVIVDARFGHRVRDLWTEEPSAGFCTSGCHFRTGRKGNMGRRVSGWTTGN